MVKLSLMNKQKSFTLIELLVVIVIIGILAGVIIVSVSSSINKANFAKAQSFSNTVQNELLGDLVSEWTFDSPAVANITEDTWGNNDGTLMGANGLPQIQTKENCVYGTCYLFDGVDDYVIVASNGLNKFSYQSFTISAWVKPEIIQNYTLIWSYDYTSHVSPYYSQHIRTENGKFYFGWNNGVSIQSIVTSNIASVNNWHYLVVIYTSGSQKIYVNSKEEANRIATDTITYYNQPVWIGKSNFGTTKQVVIDDVRFYNAVLSSAQIKKQYVAGLDSLLAKGNISEEEYNQKLNALAYAE